MATNADPQAKIQAGLGVTAWERTMMGWTIDNADIRGIIAARPAAQVLDAFSAGYPELKGLTDIIKSDEKLKGAFHSALSKDETMLPGLERMAATPGGSAFLKETEKLLADPGKRELLTGALNNLADQEDIKFDHLEELVNSVKEYDPANMEASDARMKKGLMGVGMTEDQSTKVMVAEKTKAAVDGFKDFFKNPEAGMGKLGGLLQDMGMGGGVASFITGFLSMITKFIGNAPGMISNMWEGSNYQAFKHMHIDPKLDSLQEDGRRAIAKSDNNDVIVIDGTKMDATAALKLKSGLEKDLDGKVKPDNILVYTKQDELESALKGRPDEDRVTVIHAEQNPLSSEMARGINTIGIDPAHLRVSDFAQRLGNAYERSFMGHDGNRMTPMFDPAKEKLDTDIVPRPNSGASAPVFAPQ
jgi:hypothetical protein